MQLSVGTKLGPYEILAPLGAGGMGEVYRARDTKLDREVAVKVLPAALARDPERLARFEREAKVLASLNHPNIAQLYGVQEADGFQALVMELIPGHTPKGPMPPDEVLRFAAQIADALGAAHDKGITHRDLKPANVMITPEGVVKVLDFGLAAVGQSSSGDSHAATNSPTLTMSPTSAGMILGTAAYMSPEQARGQNADRRSDIWAFGVLLYEMLTGQQLFRGDTVSDILASVLKEEPNLERVPAKMRPLLKCCLEKEPKKRLQAIRDWELLFNVGAADAPPERARHSQPLPWIVAAMLFLVTTLGLSFVHFREEPAAAEPMRFQIELPDRVTPMRGGVLSPDGRKIVYPAAGVEGVPRLWLRNIDSLDAHVLQAGEGLAGTRPFWSPDSRFVAFEAGGKLKKIDVTGGAPQTLCDLSGNVLGGSWNSEGVIIFGSNVGGVMRVSAGGGVAGLVTGRVDTRFNHGFPSFLPDGRHFVYHGGPASRSIYIGSLDAKPEEQSSEELVASPAGPVYAPASNLAAGYLLFLRDDTLVAQPFDTRRRKLTGEPVTIAEHVGTFLTDAFFSASENGALLYGGGGGRQARLTWFDRQGKSLSSATAPFDVFSLALSPDAGRVAVATSGVQNIWLFDFAVGASTRFTFGQDAWPVWSPDGSRIAFVAGRADRPGLYQKASSSAGNQELLLPTPPGSSRLTDWSRDGRFLLYTSFDPALKADMWVLADPLGKAADRKASPFLRTEFNEGQGRFSPDGRWIGYTSDESGKNEIFVRPFNSSSARSPQEGKWMVSRGGGTEPRWRRDGKELFYLSPDGNVMALEVSTNAVFQPGVPKVLFRAPPGATIWDAAPDGQRFLFPVLVNDSARAPFTLVLNWQAALKK